MNTMAELSAMITPNWQHHSKKEQKRSLKPQALRQSRERLKFLINKINANSQSILDKEANEVSRNLR
jgi:uncharacterized coiled-coil protein SlyX